MGAKEKKYVQSPLDALVGELINYGTDDQMVTDILYSRDQKAISAVPLRYRIIILGFIKGFALNEVNEKLISNGCEKLYGRSIYEATLMHAFNNGLSYGEWKELFKECEKMRALVPTNSHLTGSTVSLSDINAYVHEKSDLVDNVFLTQHLTNQISDSLAEIPAHKAALFDFMIKNIQSFSLNRESTRYYFCKYLMYFLETRRNNYLRALNNSLDATSDQTFLRYQLETSLDMLSVFRAQVKLTRKKHSPAETPAIINESPISLSEIYNAYQQFYFEYTSVDWITVLLEKYGSLEELTPKQISALAGSIRKYDPKLKKLNDTEVIARKLAEIERWEEEEDRKYSLDNEKTPSSSRSGETFLRKVLRGEVDLDRTTFLSFLLFFDKSSVVPPSQRLDQVRMREILINSGFPPLNDDDPFDAFFMEYMDAEDPMVFLIEEAEIMAMSEENFYLYKTYLSSKDNDKEFSEVVSLVH